MAKIAVPMLKSRAYQLIYIGTIPDSVGVGNIAVTCYGRHLMCDVPSGRGRSQLST